MISSVISMINYLSNCVRFILLFDLGGVSYLQIITFFFLLDLIVYIFLLIKKSKNSYHGNYSKKVNK